MCNAHYTRFFLKKSRKKVLNTITIYMIKKQTYKTPTKK